MCTEYITNNSAINDDVSKLLSSIAKKYGFTKFSMEVTEGIEKGDGYIGKAKTVTIRNLNNANQILNLHVKSASREKGIRDILSIAEMFSTEIYMYNTVFPHFKDLEIRNGLTPSTFMPSFFGSILNDTNEVLVLENLKEIGYRMHDCSKHLDSDHLSLVITEYATYHSLSLALRNQQPEMFEKLQSKLNNSYFEMMYSLKDIVVSKCTTLLNFLNETDSKRVRNFLQNYDCEFKELLSPPIDEYSVILHGDCWTNNILFQYPEESCVPIDVCIIDYQLSRLAPPVLDLAYFFFASSSEQEINRCTEYLELYYKILSTHLQKLGCDPNKLYPYSVFMKQWNQYARCSVIIVPLALLLMLRQENKIIDFEESGRTGLTLKEVFDHDTNNDEEYNRRVKTIISYLVKIDLL